MFTITKKPIYSFVLDGITYDVIEDDPDDKDLKVRTVHGEFEFAKEELQQLLKTGEADFKT